MELKNGYSIGEAAKALDIPASTIRYYEKNGLLPHIGRTEGGIRSFTDADLDLFRLIGHLKMSGMSLQEIREFVRLSDWAMNPSRTDAHWCMDVVRRSLSRSRI